MIYVRTNAGAARKKPAQARALNDKSPRKRGPLPEGGS